ncbi:acyl-CoA dehydrogenase family protein [Nocardia sp. NBC_00881]|uniref:acyl-CoA dehydrogenase family protein n=1 Tax=Nocardia sp. NBC_00881 TaxID=2975995 RepID=UPI00386D24A5|nr:acyl-CoA dehydrogenase family protein [Nocardia sp. NBC_00881]
MTITDPPPRLAPPLSYRPQRVDTTTMALQDALFGDDHHLQTRVRKAMVALDDRHAPGATHDSDVRRSYDMLRRLVRDLGGSSRSIAADTALLSAVFDWAAIAAPRLLPILSGHFRLVVGGIDELGSGSPYQQQCLDELDRADAIGVLLHTELGGTNGTDMQTLAVHQPDGTFLLRTPHAGAVKFMPNVAEGRVPKTVIITARLIIDGVDEGVFPFLLRLRTTAGLAAGVDVAALPDKAWAPMDNAMIMFRDAVVPAEGLLGGDWARVVGGRLVCDLSRGERFHRAINPLQTGRITLAGAAVAGARAGTAITWHYAKQRRAGAGPALSERDAFLRDLTSAVAQVYAMTTLARDVRERFGTSGDATRSVRAMLAKPILSNTALAILSVCRQRCAAQGALRANYLTEWAGNVEGIVTAEGENQVLQVTTGKLPRQVTQGRAPRHMDITGLQVANSPVDTPWWQRLLTERERALASTAQDGDTGADAFGADSAAIELSTATAERLAADSLLAAAQHSSDRSARGLLGVLAAAYGLERLQAHALWYIAQGLLSSERAAQLGVELTACRRELAAHLDTLVNAFGIPRLAAPIATDDYQQAWLDFAGWDQLVRGGE